MSFSCHFLDFNITEFVMYDGFVVAVTLLEKIGFGKSFLSSVNNSECFPVLFFSLQCSFVLQQYIFLK